MGDNNKTEAPKAPVMKYEIDYLKVRDMMLVLQRCKIPGNLSEAHVEFKNILMAPTNKGDKEVKDFEAYLVQKNSQEEKKQ